MESSHTGTIDALRPLLSSSLEAIEPAARDAVIDLLPGELEPAEPPERPANRKLVEKALGTDAYYAIHSDDLGLLKEAAVVAAACYALFPNPIAVVGGLVVFLYRYRKKRARLTSDQGIVLLTLKSAPSRGWTADEVAGRLPLKERWSSRRVGSILEGLKTVRCEDNTVTGFVREEHGRWWAVDV